MHCIHTLGHIVAIYRSQAPMTAIRLPEQPPVPQTRSSVRPLLLLVIGLCLLFIVTYALRLDARDRMEAALVTQQQINAEAAARGAALEKQLASASKPTRMDKIARENLGLVRVDEVRIVPVGGGFADKEAAADTVAAPLPAIWRQWINFLFPRT